MSKVKFISWSTRTNMGTLTSNNCYEGVYSHIYVTERKNTVQYKSTRKMWRFRNEKWKALNMKPGQQLSWSEDWDGSLCMGGQGRL